VRRVMLAVMVHLFFETKPVSCKWFGLFGMPDVLRVAVGESKVKGGWDGWG
jgi:hypothetical protein